MVTDQLSSTIPRHPPLTHPQPSAPHDSHIYSRASGPNTTRLEAVLSSLLGGPAITYSSGLAAFHALLVHYNPKTISIGPGYHGCHGVVALMGRLTGLTSLPLDCPDTALRPGDVIHVETPVNPTGEARDLAYYAAKAKRTGAILTVDATFAPPPLLAPFDFGAAVAMHSGTKYIGGHSDMLAGVLALSPAHAGEAAALKADRLLLGGVLGSLEGWLGLRSVRTLDLRVRRQSTSAAALVAWLEAERRDPTSTVGKSVEQVLHASLQPEASQAGSWLQTQMPNGYGPVFAVVLKSGEAAKRLPGKLMLFHHATSLGGVESLIEWRTMSDPNVDEGLLRISVGVEDVDDLKADLVTALYALQQEGY